VHVWQPTFVDRHDAEVSEDRAKLTESQSAAMLLQSAALILPSAALILPNLVKPSHSSTARTVCLSSGTFQSCIAEFRLFVKKNPFSSCFRELALLDSSPAGTAILSAQHTLQYQDGGVDITQYTCGRKQQQQH